MPGLFDRPEEAKSNIIYALKELGFTQHDDGVCYGLVASMTYARAQGPGVLEAWVNVHSFFTSISDRTIIAVIVNDIKVVETSLPSAKLDSVPHSLPRISLKSDQENQNDLVLELNFQKLGFETKAQYIVQLRKLYAFLCDVELYQSFGKDESFGFNQDPRFKGEIYTQDMDLLNIILERDIKLIATQLRVDNSQFICSSPQNTPS